MSLSYLEYDFEHWSQEYGFSPELSKQFKLKNLPLIYPYYMQKNVQIFNLYAFSCVVPGP